MDHLLQRLGVEFDAGHIVAERCLVDVLQTARGGTDQDHGTRDQVARRASVQHPPGRQVARAFRRLLL